MFTKIVVCQTCHHNTASSFPSLLKSATSAPTKYPFHQIHNIVCVNVGTNQVVVFSYILVCHQCPAAMISGLLSPLKSHTAHPWWYDVRSWVQIAPVKNDITAPDEVLVNIVLNVLYQNHITSILLSPLKSHVLAPTNELHHPGQITVLLNVMLFHTVVFLKIVVLDSSSTLDGFNPWDYN